MIIALYFAVGVHGIVTPLHYFINDDTMMPLSIYLRNLVVTNTTDTAELSLFAGNIHITKIAAQGGGIGVCVLLLRWVIVVCVIPLM